MSQDPTKQLWGKVAVITGSSSGIGAATALEFTRLGAAVTLTSIEASELEDVRRSCEELNCGQPKPLVVVGDINEDVVRERIVDETIKTFGKIDILINNAGFGRVGSIESTSMEQLDEVMGVLFRAPYHLTMLAVPHLLKSKGNIINTSSVMSVRPDPGTIAYCAAKAAIDNFTQALAIDLSPRGVRVNSVRPGYIRTSILKRMDITEDQMTAIAIKESNCNLFCRPGEPQEIANVMAFLASDKASFITGANINADGGHSIKPFAPKDC